MRTRFGILLLLIISLFECQVGQEVKLEPNKLPPSIEENTKASFLFYACAADVLNTRLRDFQYEELLPFKDYFKIEPFIPRSIILQLVRGNSDLELIALANTFEESDFADFTEKEVYDLLREDLYNQRLNLGHVYSFMMFVFKRYPSLSVFDQFHYFSPNLSSYFVKLRMCLINRNIAYLSSSEFCHPDWTYQPFSAIFDRKWAYACFPFYHPILHAYVIFKGLNFISYTTPKFLASSDVDDKWYFGLRDERIISEISKLGDLVIASDAPDPTDDILFTINTLLIG